MTYQEFLSSKRIHDEGTGFEVPDADLPAGLYEFQRHVTQWALRRGRAAVFSDCGTGKSFIEAAWADAVARHQDGAVLVLAPLAVGRQWVREAAKLGIKARLVRKQSDLQPGINVVNYEMLPHFQPDGIVGLVCDECFPAGTPVDTPLGMVDIESIQPGAMILNASGVDTVAAVARREVQDAIRISVDGRAITSSPNHPYFTERGWVRAGDLRAGDQLLETAAAVRLVQEGVCAAVSRWSEAEILRSVLLGEMADAPAGKLGARTLCGVCQEARAVRVGMAALGEPGGNQADRANPGADAIDRPGSAGQDIEASTGDRASAARARRKRARHDDSAGFAIGCARRIMGVGVRGEPWQEATGVPDVLQAGSGGPGAQARDRSGRLHARQPETPGRKEGREAGFARVDRVEVLQPGDPQLERLRDANGKLYFYDLEAIRHPSFSIGGVLVHNSSIIKSYGGVIRGQLIEFGRAIPYRLACTATPAPNDTIELINHAEFLGVMAGKQMIALFFRQDGNTTHAWRLKRHAREAFWRWMATWCVAFRDPADIGFPQGGFDLLPLNIHRHVVETPAPAGQLFPTEAVGIGDQRRIQRASFENRLRMVREIVEAEPDEQWLIWTHYNYESAELARVLGAVEVKGADTQEHKEDSLLGFSDGTVRRLVSKSRIAGYGMNWQSCARMVFASVDYSYEQFYQSVRRSWRFGQTRPVDVHVVISDAEQQVFDKVQQKERKVSEMMDRVVQHMRGASDVSNVKRQEMHYMHEVAHGQRWELQLGDSVETMANIKADSIGLSVFSPPFPGMYAYTNSNRDLGNSSQIDQMIDHYRYVADGLLRILMPGRMCCVHLMQLTAMNTRDGYIGIKDYRGKMIIAMEEAGFRYAGEVTIDKNPQVQATRNKERGLLFKSLATDSSVLRMALADYLLLFRKPGDNPVPIKAGVSAKYNEGGGWITESEWIEWAAPVWYRQTKDYPGGIRETDVLNYREARGDDDEKHLAPLQLGVIHRAVMLWSNPGDIVYSPFAGIGSEGYQAILDGRCFAGGELKREYFDTACRNLKHAEQQYRQRARNLFTDAEEAAT